MIVWDEMWYWQSLANEKGRNRRSFELHYVEIKRHVITAATKNSKYFGVLCAFRVIYRPICNAFYFQYTAPLILLKVQCFMLNSSRSIPRLVELSFNAIWYSIYLSFEGTFDSIQSFQMLQILSAVFEAQSTGKPWIQSLSNCFSATSWCKL